MLGATQLPLPLHLGHECVAEVLAVGERVATVRSATAWSSRFRSTAASVSRAAPGAPAAARACRRSPCTAWALGAGHWGGAFSDRLAVPYADAMLVALPDGIDPAAAASVADNVCDAYRHIAPHLPDAAARDPNAEVLVFAAHSPRSLFTASCPLYTGMIALALGARNVHFADSPPVGARARAAPGDARAAPARAAPPPPGSRSSSTSASTGSPAPLPRPRRTACARAPADCTAACSIPMLRMYVRNATLHVGRTHVRALMPEVLELMARGGLHPQAITTTIAPLDEAPSVLREHFLGGESVKTVLTHLLRSIRRRLARLPSEADGTLIRLPMPSGWWVGDARSPEMRVLRGGRRDAVAGTSGTGTGRCRRCSWRCTLVTGLVDAASYLKLGHVFVANMTGNVVFLGFALAGASGLSAGSSLVALGRVPARRARRRLAGGAQLGASRAHAARSRHALRRR